MGWECHAVSLDWEKCQDEFGKYFDNGIVVYWGVEFHSMVRSDARWCVMLSLSSIVLIVIWLSLAVLMLIGFVLQELDNVGISKWDEVQDQDEDFFDEVG